MFNGPFVDKEDEEEEDFVEVGDDVEGESP